MAGALVKVKVSQSCPTLCDPMVCPWNSPAQNTAAGCHSLLQGIFLTRESNWGLLHCRQILYHLSYQGNLANTLGKYQVEVDTFPLFALLPWIPPSFHFCLFLPLVSISPLLSLGFNFSSSFLLPQLSFTSHSSSPPPGTPPTPKQLCPSSFLLMEASPVPRDENLEVNREALMSQRDCPSLPQC